MLDAAVKAHGATLAHPSGQLIPLPGDITSKKDISALVSEISSREKHVNLLVNNAGISLTTSTVEKGDKGPEALSKELFNEDEDEWMQIYKTNVIG